MIFENNHEDNRFNFKTTISFFIKRNLPIVTIFIKYRINFLSIFLDLAFYIESFKEKIDQLNDLIYLILIVKNKNKIKYSFYCFFGFQRRKSNVKISAVNQ